MTRLIYILAASHSGSTLLAMLLGSHPEICTVGELKATALGDPARYRCACGALIRVCPFWAKVARAMAGRGVAFEVTAAGTDLAAGASPYARRLLRPLHRGRVLEAVRDVALRLSPAWRSLLPEIQQRNTALVESLREVTGKRVIVDSSKVGLRLKYLLRNPALDVQVVRLVRDGRGVALAYMEPARFADAARPELRGGGSGGGREEERLSAGAAAREWRRSNEEAEAILAALPPGRSTVVHYEKLCREPEVELQKLFAFAGLPPLATSPDFRAANRHVIGNGMRLDRSAEIRLDERWRAALTEEDLRAFDAVAGPLNRRYGYA